MYAIEMIDYGGVDVLVATKTAVQPIIKPTQVLVKQHATAIDPYDVKFRQGLMGQEKTVPLISGSSVAGEIVALGEEVTGFTIGDRVAASPHLNSYAEFVALGRKAVAKIPDNVSYAQAAALALGAQTGYQMITEDLNVQADESVLILGGAGSVGLTALQMAKLRGVNEIFTTAVGEGISFLKQFDSNLHVIDARAEQLAKIIPEGVDVILDTIGHDTLKQALSVLKPTGRLVSLVGDDSDVRVTHGYLKSNGEQLRDLLQLVSEDKIKVIISDIKPFNVENLKTFQTLKHVIGKLVLTFE
ncbi:NADP-dependent oxidoreductase [Leuconostoc gasicomitatum]|uniref:NADP-dependent oxidoreductase n=1 Tax=Leuconostoc gasicomitatum TaxID=115778 RepID=UPI000BD4B3C1|nr:NADP-dependent oxidoreductase [Leuconostoc gasicomitatum]MBZ5943572.1 NADP-dependent oxidoreductase [Leuconostoc gasicomitatum]MBZ5948863.1 NADP-dependent oxidoreductase [Leuconostoc gasicomitatum]MBZ5951806.1 NADP-dependent oxidoreductase [Leuconostoc gasicomitatum]MBZ5968361.1 NADP-dependent oxidoreductase [Leuconostoc gasicomitatum]MBZ5970896.1 NADP-dependent oxidoreductase [Leuconostoc gasicomitatum]